MKLFSPFEKLGAPRGRGLGGALTSRYSLGFGGRSFPILFSLNGMHCVRLGKRKRGTRNGTVRKRGDNHVLRCVSPGLGLQKMESCYIEIVLGKTVVLFLLNLGVRIRETKLRTKCCASKGVSLSVPIHQRMHSSFQ